MMREIPCAEGRAAVLLSGCRLFRGCGEGELRRLLPLLKPQLWRCGKGETLLRVGEPVSRVSLLLSGRVLEYRPAFDGTAHILARHRAGTLLGLEACFSGKGESHTEYLAETDCEIVRMDLMALSRTEPVLGRLLELLSDGSVRKTYRLDVLGTAGLRAKILTFFRTMHDKTQSDTFRLRMTQAEFACYLNTNRSYLSRELNQMQKDGIIKIMPNRRYQILQWSTMPPAERSKRENADMDTGTPTELLQK